MDEQQLATTFGAAALDRKDEPARVLRYQSDACTLFVSLYRRNGTPWQAEFADAYDTASAAPAGRPVRRLGGGAEAARRLTCGRHSPRCSS